MDKNELKRVRELASEVAEKAGLLSGHLWAEEPDPPKPVGVIARPGMIVEAPFGRAVVVSWKAWMRADRSHAKPVGVMPVVDTPYIYLDGRPGWNPARTLKTMSGEPITGYEDD